MTTPPEVDIPGFTGRVSAGGPDYDDTLSVWNRAVTATPAAVAHCRGPSDVVAALRYARDRDLPIAVRAGGHSFAGTGLVHGGLVLDVRPLRTVRHDERDRIVALGAGLRWADVDDVLGPHGWAATGGSVSSVGVAGFTLGTGLGWLGRAHGTAGDNLLAAQVVTAAGDVLQVDAERHPDLYWALRGGCGNFGVVTELQLRTHPIRTVLAGPLIYPVDQAGAALRELVALTPHLPDSLSWAAVLTTAPPDPALPREVAGRPVLMVPLLCLSADERAAEALRPLRAVGRPVLDLVADMDYRVFQRSGDAAAPDGWCWDVRSEWLTGLDDAAVDVAVTAAAEAVSPLSEVLFRPLGGAVAGPRAPDTPFSHRNAAYLVEVIACWPPGADAGPARTWMEKTWAGLLHRSAGGPCVNHVGLGEGRDRVRAAYSAAAYARLREVKRRYDPDNVFRSVQNIAP